MRGRGFREKKKPKTKHLFVGISQGTGEGSNTDLSEVLIVEHLTTAVEIFKTAKTHSF
jgi:hypothetical protein